MALSSRPNIPDSFSASATSATAPLDSIPYLFFHGRQPLWDEKSRQRHQNFAFSWGREFLDSEPLPTNISVNVSQPAVLHNWLIGDRASRITTLHVHIDPFITSEDVPSWVKLFSVLAREATNLLHLSVYWDAEGWMKGLGKDVTFIRALVTLKIQSTVVIEGFYGVHWPEFMELAMGLRPVEKQLGTLYG